MMPFGSECCKGSKLHVDLFLESYTRRTTHNGILKNCTVACIAIKVFLRCTTPETNPHVIWSLCNILNQMASLYTLPSY